MSKICFNSETDNKSLTLFELINTLYKVRSFVHNNIEHSHHQKHRLYIKKWS